MFSITGILKVKSETRSVSDTFKVREFVLTDNSGMYPQHIQFQLSQERVSLLDDINVNDMVAVTFNIRGREWTNPQGEVKYFNSLDAWRLEKGMGTPTGMGAATTATTTQQAPVQPINPSTAETLVDDTDDDLPF